MEFLDSCIVIDYVNGKIAIDEEDKANYYINSIVEMEVVVGAKNKREPATINKKISGFMILDIEQDIMEFASKLLNRYALSHNMTIYDAIIAASCMMYNMPLVTYNKRDFRFLDMVLVDI